MKKKIEKYCGNCCWFFGECTDGDGCCAKHYWEEPKNGRDPMLTRCDRKACADYVSRDEKFIHLKKLTEMLQMLSEGTQEEVAPFTEALQFAIKHVTTFDRI